MNKLTYKFVIKQMKITQKNKLSFATRNTTMFITLLEEIEERFMLHDLTGFSLTN